MAKLDVVVFDIQDVGVRFYTFISSMHYMMEAAAESGIGFLVLDRLNPNGGFVDGPMLDENFRSFIGMHNIPLLHGMTVAELALMIKGEGWINAAEKLALNTVAMQKYKRTAAYNLPVPPSPNLPNATALKLYPSLGFFEATPASIGRGTDFPFQVIGFDKFPLGDFKFTPGFRPGSALEPKLMDVPLRGNDLRHSNIQGLDLRLFISVFKQFEQAGLLFFSRADFMDKLAGTDQLRLAIEAGHSAEQIKLSWQDSLPTFKRLRAPYLLYPDT
jgi:uncharacterized protein YbbC (DUF1343 family)